jgi:hypothetical protein
MSALAQLAKMGVKGTDALVDALRSAKKFVAPQDEALALAQQRAALPIEQGGLGLPPTNTAMDRAKAMGFDTPAFHGTSADFANMNMSGGAGKTRGAGAFFSNNPAMASTYASKDGGNVIPVLLKDGRNVAIEGKGANWNWLDAKTKMKAPKLDESKAFSKPLNKVFPEDFRWNDALSTDDIAQWANKQGYGGVNFNAVRDRGPNGVFNTPEAALPSDITAVFNPDLVRSRFAAFDPWRKTAATAAAFGVAAPNLLAEELRKK